jgi:hypothetical protein
MRSASIPNNHNIIRTKSTIFCPDSNYCCDFLLNISTQKGGQKIEK